MLDPRLYKLINYLKQVTFARLSTVCIFLCACVRLKCLRYLNPCSVSFSRRCVVYFLLSSGRNEILQLHSKWKVSWLGRKKWSGITAKLPRNAHFVVHTAITTWYEKLLIMNEGVRRCTKAPDDSEIRWRKIERLRNWRSARASLAGQHFFQQSELFAAGCRANGGSSICTRTSHTQMNMYRGKGNQWSRQLQS